MNMVWVHLLLLRVSTLVEDSRTGEGVEWGREHFEGAPLAVAEAVSRALAPNGILLPTEDKPMLQILVRDGVEVAVADAPTGAVLETVHGRCALVGPSAVIESSGEALSYVPLEPGRYVRAWLIPGLAYPGVA